MRKFLSTLGCFIIISMAFIQSAFASFTDVYPQNKFYNAIEYFSYEYPILKLDREEFYPLQHVTKAEFYKLLYESIGFNKSDRSVLDIQFYDVSGDEWFAPYVQEALDDGLLVFSEENPNFFPGNSISRKEGIEKILNKYKLLTPFRENTSIGYEDVSPEDSFANIAQITYKMQLLSDYTTKLFIPDKPLTRAEAVYVLYQIHQTDYFIETGIDESILSDITSEKAFTIFLDVWEKIMNEYIDKEGINKEMLIYGAISGMVSELDDPYSNFLIPTESSDYFETLEGELDGIGIYLSNEDGQYIILTPIKGTPAEKAGLKPNDIILEVDDVIVTGLATDEVINMIRGVPGTSVKLKIKRESKTYIFNIVREHIDIPYVETEMINGIGVIYYNQFTNNSHSQFNTEIEYLLSNNPKGLILDLRNNPGGYLYSAEKILSRFVPYGEKLLTLKFANGVSYIEKSMGPGDLKDYPLVILINEGSASASEIVAIALKELNSAQIVGINSFGKSKIQEIFSYEDGSSLKLSTAKWYSPDGTDVDEVGVTPDYIVEMIETDMENNKDTQLKKALEIIK